MTIFDVERAARAPETSKVLVVRLDEPTDRALRVMQWLRKETKTKVAVDAIWTWLEPLVPHDEGDFDRTRRETTALLQGQGGDDTYLFDTSRSFRLPLWLRARLQLVSRLAGRNQADLVRAAIQARAAALLAGRDLDQLELEMGQEDRQELGDLMDLVTLTSDAVDLPALAAPKRDLTEHV